MSVRSTLAATPALLRVGLAESIAYRAEMLVWILATTMPLVMMALFATVAREAPIGGFGEAEVIAYFLATFIVRQLTGSWAAWQINMEVRQGALAARLLRPVHPLWAYAMEGLAAIPIRAAIAIPAAAIALVITSADALPRDAGTWLAFALASLGGWVLTFLINALLGSLCLWTESSLKLVDLYLVFFFVFSGYLVPLAIFPGWLRTVVDAMPFRFQIGTPVEILVGGRARDALIQALALEAAWLAALLGLTLLVWRRGLARFAAYGG